MVHVNGTVMAVQVTAKVLHCPHHSKPLQLADPIVFLVLLQRAAGKGDRSDGLIRLCLRDSVKEELLSKLGISQFRRLGKQGLQA